MMEDEEDEDLRLRQEPGDLAAYTVVSGLIAGVDAKRYAAPAVERYGRWSPIVRDLFNVWQAGGHAGVFRRYLELVYAIPDFALLMATFGRQSPTRQWQPEELPNRMHPSPAAPAALPMPPAARPQHTQHRPRGGWTLYELLVGEDEQPPAARHAVREEQVYAALRELGEATVAELARHTGQDRGNVHRRVQKLLEQNMIERHVTPQAIVYRVRA